MSDEIRYYEAMWLENGDASQVARPVDQHRNLAHRFDKPDRITEKLELVWTWPSARHPPGDVVAAANGLRLVSPLVRKIFDDHLTADDKIQWFPGTIVDPAGQRLPYWVPHFPDPDELFDVANTTFGPGGLPIRYSLSPEKLSGHAVTVIPGEAFIFVLSQPVVDALRAANAVGIMIVPAPVSGACS